MASQLIPVAALLLSSAFLLLASGLQGLLLPVRGTIENFSTFQLALIGTGWSVGFVVGCILMPKVVRSAGHVRAYGVMAAVSAITILLNLMIIAPEAWIALRTLSGFCFAGAAMIVESWLNEKATRENRGTIFSIYQMTNFAASTAGQLLFVLGPPTGFFYFTLGAIFYCLALLPTALSTAEHPRPLKQTRFDLRSLYRNSPVSAVGCVLIGMVNGAFGTLGAVYAQRIGLPVPSVALMMSGAVLGGSLIQFPLGRLSDAMDRRKVLIGVAFGAITVAMTIAILEPRSAPLVIGLAILFGAMIYPLYALAVAHANDFARTDEFVKIASGLLFLYGFGTMLGPLMAAPLMDRVSPEGLFAFCAVVHLALAVYTLFRMTRRPSAPPRESFQGMPVPKTATPESAVLDPRSEPETGPEPQPPVPEPLAEPEKRVE